MMHYDIIIQIIINQIKGCMITKKKFLIGLGSLIRDAPISLFFFFFSLLISSCFLCNIYELSSQLSSQLSVSAIKCIIGESMSKSEPVQFCCLLALRPVLTIRYTPSHDFTDKHIIAQNCVQRQKMKKL